MLLSVFPHIDKLIVICLKCLLKPLLEITGDDNTVFLRRYYKTTDISNLCITLQDVVVLIKRIIRSVCRKAALAIDMRL